MHLTGETRSGLPDGLVVVINGDSGRIKKPADMLCRFPVLSFLKKMDYIGSIFAES